MTGGSDCFLSKGNSLTSEGGIPGTKFPAQIQCPGQFRGLSGALDRGDQGDLHAERDRELLIMSMGKCRVLVKLKPEADTISTRL